MQDLETPVGLVNLGSTCYVNAVLQTLFSIAPFRRAVYQAGSQLPDDAVLQQLR